MISMKILVVFISVLLSVADSKMSSVDIDESLSLNSNKKVSVDKDFRAETAWSVNDIPQKTPGSIRISFMGDSITEGNSPWPSKLV